MMLRFSSATTIATLVVLFFSFNVFAATVQTVKNKKVLISLEAQKVKVGEQYFTLNDAGKKKAVVKILQTKGDRAVAEIVKGKAQPGYTLSDTPIATDDKKKKEPQEEYTGNSWGIMASYLQSSMSVSFKPNSASDTITSDMKGTSFGAVGFYDYAWSPDFQIRGIAGLEQLKVSGTISTSNCKSSTACDVSITYLSLYGGGKYNIYNSKMRWWVGGAYGLLIALQKSSTILEESQITTNQMYVFNTGLDYPLSDNAYMPITLDYGMFPSTASVKATVMFFRIGWAKNF